VGPWGINQSVGKIGCVGNMLVLKFKNQFIKRSCLVVLVDLLFLIANFNKVNWYRCKACLCVNLINVLRQISRRLWCSSVSLY